MKRRITTLRLSLVLLGLIFAGRLFYVQIISGDDYVAQALSEQQKKYEIPAERGRIYFLDGGSEAEQRTPAVLNQTLPTLYADPRYVEDPYGTAEALVKVIGGDVNDLRRLMEDEQRAYVVLAKKLNQKKVDELSKLDLPGIGLQDTSYRSYPESDLAAQALGFTNDDGRGQYGLEGALDDVLRGTPGQLSAVTDVNGIPLTTEDDAVLKDPVDGRDVVLTIDRNVQRYVEDALKRGVRSSRGKSGSVIVINPSSGAILAMANYPTYEPAKFSAVKDPAVFVNGVVSTPYEVGSVMKPFTMSSGLNTGAVKADDTFYDAGFVQVDDRRIENAIAIAPGERTMTTVIEQSLNTGVVHVLKQLGQGEINAAAKGTLYDYFKNRFGLTRITGVEQAAEAEGVIFSPDAAEGNNVRYANMTFGQGLSVTMIQLAAAYATLVNGGIYYKPYLVHSTLDKMSEEESVTSPAALRSGVISAETSQSIRRMMEAGIKYAGVSGGYREDYRIGGKTGTSQKLQPDGTYSDSLEVGTFVGFGAADDAQYLVVTKVDEPQVPGFAGSVGARPIFADISNWLIDYYRIAPL